jgi:NDP-hexose 4,6-dehydratase
MTGLVAVTGAEGFIGSHLVEALVEQGHRVRAMAQYNSFDSRGWLDTLPTDVLDNVEVILGDVRDPASVHDLIVQAEAVYHLAALIAIPYSYRAPRSYVETNVLGTLNVLEAVRSLGTERLVHTSTSETYGTARTVPITEAHPLQTQSPYAASKAAADKLAESYYDSFDLPVVTLRPFNTFGPRQSARAFIPTVVSQIAAGATEVTVGALEPTRDFTFVKDTAAAFVAAGTAPASEVVGQVLNAGSGKEISMGRLAGEIAALMGRDVAFRSDPARHRPAKSEVMRLVCDSTKLRGRTGWQPKHTLQDGLKITIEWFLDATNLSRYRPTDYTV